MIGVTGAALTAVNFWVPVPISFGWNGYPGFGQAGMDPREGLVRLHRVAFALAQEVFERLEQLDRGVDPVSYTHLTLPTIYSV